MLVISVLCVLWADSGPHPVGSTAVSTDLPLRKTEVAFRRGDRVNMRNVSTFENDTAQMDPGVWAVGAPGPSGVCKNLIRSGRFTASGVLVRPEQISSV